MKVEEVRGMEKAEGKRRRWEEKWRRLKGEGGRGKRNGEGEEGRGMGKVEWRRRKRKEEWGRLKGEGWKGKRNGEGKWEKKMEDGEENRVTEKV